MTINYVLMVQKAGTASQLVSNDIIEHFRGFKEFKSSKERNSGTISVISSLELDVVIPTTEECLIGQIKDPIRPGAIQTGNLSDLGRFFSLFDGLESEEEVRKREMQLAAFQGGWIALRVQNSGFVFARDFPGLLPCYFLETRHLSVFSNSSDISGTVHNFTGEKCHIGPLPPGITPITGKLSRSPRREFDHPAVASRRELFTGDKHSILEKLEERLILALETKLSFLPEEKRVAVLLSGGVDSSVLVLLLERIGFDRYELFFTGMPGSKDHIYARLVAKQVKKQLEEILLDEKRITGALHYLAACLPSKFALNPVHISIAIPSLIALKEVAMNDIGYFLAGQGADELFGGYARYRELHINGNYTDLVTALRHDVLHIGPENLDRDNAVAALAGVKPLLPYLDVRVIEYVTSLDLKLLFGEVGERIEGKMLLRELASKLGVPETVANRPKTAMQYGTGVMRLLKQGSKKHKKNLREWLEELRAH